MKDLPHHMKKLNRRIIRSMDREEVEKLPDLPTWPDSAAEKKKKAKRKLRAEGKSRVPVQKSEEERNKEMRKGRVPVFDRHSAPEKHARPTHKKTPRI